MAVTHVACGWPSPGDRKLHVPCTEPNSTGPASVAATWWDRKKMGMPIPEGRTRERWGHVSCAQPERGVHGFPVER